MSAVIGQIRRKRRCKAQAEFTDSFEALIQRFGSNLGGFAIVVWNRQGEPDSAYFTGRSQVAPDLIPTFVHDVLNRARAGDDLADAGLIESGEE
jgi:hypothetical protein